MDAIASISNNKLYIHPLINTPLDIEIATAALLKQNALQSISKHQLTKREYLYTTLIA